MRLEQLEVWDWQGLDHRCLDDLSPRINLVVGPNGVGKSRLFNALEAVFFEHHKGRAEYKLAWQTRGQDKAPRVRVRFVLDGVCWTLDKQFVKSPRARLQGGGEVLEDAAAEHRLRELVHTRKASNRGAKPEHKGIWPLLWVPQHESHLTPSTSLNDTTRGRLDDVLSAEAGVVAAGPVGERILERVRAEHAQYFTGATGKPTGELARAMKRLEAAESQLEAAVRERDASRAEAERLAQHRARLVTVTEELVAVATELEAAEQARREAEICAGELQTRAGLVRERALELKQAEGKRAERARRETELAEARQRSDDLRTALARAQQRLQATAERVTVAEAEVAARAELAEAAQRAAREATRQAERWRLTRAHDEAASRLAAAETDEAAGAAVTRELAGLTIDEAAYQDLEGLEQRLRDAQVALRAAAARVTIRALRGTDVDGDALPAQEVRELIVERARTLTIGDLVEVTVEPGGDDLAARQQGVAQAEADLTEGLERRQVDRLGAARSQLDRRRQLQADRERHETALVTRVPEGLGALRAQCETLQGQLEALGGPLEAADGEEAPAPQAAQEAHTEAQQSLKAAEIERATAAAAHEAARRQVSDLEVDAERLGDRIAQLEARLGEAGDAAALEAAMDQATARLAEAERQRDRAAREVEARDLAELQATCERLDKARRNQDRERAQLKEAIAQSRGALGNLDGDELHARVQDAAAEVNAARVEHDRIARRAAAARTLLEALEGARNRTRDAVLSLVRDRVAPYLRRVLPDHDLPVKEGWTIDEVRRADGTAFQFEELSGGLKEQVALVVRFALAESLAESQTTDEPLPIVLDDPLVHTDPERLKTMIALIDLASRRHLQLILLSCDEADYSALGEDRRFRLDEGGTVTVR